MPNEKNLVPNEKRTPSERRKNAQKAGKASGAARRAKKTLKDYAEFLLSLPVTERKEFNKLSKMGVPPEGTNNKMRMIAALMLRACEGDVSAAKEMRSIIGEDVAAPPKQADNNLLDIIRESTSKEGNENEIPDVQPTPADDAGVVEQK